MNTRNLLIALLPKWPTLTLSKLRRNWPYLYALLALLDRLNWRTIAGHLFQPLEHTVSYPPLA